MKVLVVKLSAFGDIIHALPALDDLLNRSDVSEVHWLIDQRFAFLAPIFPPQVQLHSVALKGRKPLLAAWQIIRKLRREKFDVAIDLQGLMKSALLAKLSGAVVYGFDQTKVREKPASWFQRAVPFHVDERHIVQQCRRVASGPWVQHPESIPYQSPKIRKRLTDAPLPEKIAALLSQAVILHVGGAWATKQLPDATWVKIAEGVKRMGFTALLCWGTGEERQKAARIASESQAVVLPERLELLPLCRVLKESKGVIASDTGVLHLAGALGAATVSFWGASASWRSAPLGVRDFQVESAPDCGPCFKRNCANFICMDMIRADRVLEQLERAVETSTPAQGDNIG